MPHKNNNPKGQPALNSLPVQKSAFEYTDSLYTVQIIPAAS